MKSNGSVVLPIQYLRGIAAMMVVWHHARGQFGSYENVIYGTFGTSGVDIFFVISGFIMAISVNDPNTTPWKFMRRRIVRVVPMYWLLTLLMVCIDLVRPQVFKTLIVTGATLVESLLFIPHFSLSFPTSVFPLLVPGWTLNYEMFFYVVVAASLLMPSRIRFYGVSLILLTLVVVGLSGDFRNNAIGATYTDPLLLEFVGGIWIWKYYSVRRPVLRLNVLVPIGLLGALMLINRDVPPLGGFTQIAGAVLLVFSATNERFHQWQSQLLKRLGDSSYSLYLTHVFVLGFVRLLWSKLGLDGHTGEFAAYAFMLTAVPLCALAGWFAYKWVENPLLARFKSSSSALPTAHPSDV